MELIYNNKKAFFNYFISDTIEAGIELKGSEVKSVREKGVSLAESFVSLKNGELFLQNAYIKPFEKATSFVPDERRTRKLLLHKEEIEKLSKKVKEKGFSIMPTKIYIKNGKVKVEVGLAKGKKLYDKRETMKDKEVKKTLDRYMKSKQNFWYGGDWFRHGK